MGVRGRPPGATTESLAVADLAPLLFTATALVVTLMLVLLVRARRKTTFQAMAIGQLVQLVVPVSLVAKHPGVRYLLPIAATLPVAYEIALESFDSQAQHARAFAASFGAVIWCC